VICNGDILRTQPILLSEWVKPGMHINLVGSSYLGRGRKSMSHALVARARYVADYRPGVLAQGAS
jgi:ornithine cyclodeaminase